MEYYCYVAKDSITSKTYIVCWDDSYANCLAIDSQLRDTGTNYLVHNVSSYDVDLSNWCRADDVRYYGHFRNSLRDFVSSGHDVFIFNAGDLVYHDYAGYTTKIESLFTVDSSIGAFAPSMTNDAFSGDGSFILASSLHTGLFLSTHTNGIYTSLSRSVAQTILDFMDWAEFTSRIDWSTMRSGWGLDTAYCALVVYRDLKVYRDGTVRMFHPDGTSYDWRHADTEMKVVLRVFKEFCSTIGIDQAVIQQTYSTVYDKANTKRQVSVSDVYVNSDSRMVF